MFMPLELSTFGPGRELRGRGTKPFFSITLSTLSTVSLETPWRLLITRETVEWDTPANFAIVTIDIFVFYLDRNSLSSAISNILHNYLSHIFLFLFYVTLRIGKNMSYLLMA